MNAAIVDRKRFDLAIAGTVVRADAWASLQEIHALLEHARGLGQRADDEMQAVREMAYAAGYQSGVKEAQRDMTAQLAALNERQARLLRDMESRVVNLACAVVERIAPGLGAERLVPQLVNEAAAAAQAEQFLLIRVHPDARAAVAADLDAVRQAHPAVGIIELVEDETLDPLSCVVVSEAGEVRAGVNQQIDAIRSALLAAAEGGA